MRAMSVLPLVPPWLAAAPRLAMGLRVAVLADHAIALYRAAAVHHHFAVLLLAHAGHAGGHLLEAAPVGRADLGEEIDVAARRDRPVEIAPQHRLLLLLGHPPFVEIGALVRLEARPVLGLH